MALDLSIPPLNHGSSFRATEVQTGGGTSLTMVDDYKDRLEQAMADKEKSVAQLARDLKISYQAVVKVLAGGRFGMENNLKAAKVLGVRAEWLATGKGEKEPAWPFTDELLAQVSSLPVDELISLEVSMWVHLRAERHMPAWLIRRDEAAHEEQVSVNETITQKHTKGRSSLHPIGPSLAAALINKPVRGSAGNKRGRTKGNDG